MNIEQIFKKNHSQKNTLYAEYINAQLAKVVETIGFEREYAQGVGAYLFDRQEKRYLDCIAGFGVFNIGRNHPKVKKALQEALDLNLPNMVQMDTPLLSSLLAKKLLELLPENLTKIFFTNSGTEAIEGAIKFARRFTKRSKILFWDHSFHGLTTGSLALNGNDEFRNGFGELLPGTIKIAFNNLDALENHLKNNDVAAFVIEPIQGKGVNIADDSFYVKAAQLCKEYGTLLIADEVQTGFGRTGKWFAFEHWALKPDIVCMAKALSGGLIPIGAIAYGEGIFKAVYPDMESCMVHSSTFSRNTLAMVAGLATLEVIEEEGLVEQADRLGGKLIEGMHALEKKYEMIKCVRGKGLMLAIEFGEPHSLALKTGWKLLNKMHESLYSQMIVIPLMRDHGILAQVAGHAGTIRFLPSLVITQEDVDYLLAALDQVIGATHQFPGAAWSLGKELASLAMRAR